MSAPIHADGGLAAFAAVREAQCAPHPTGRPSRLAHTAGRCHLLAIALSERMGWPMMALTRPDAPGRLVHVGVLDGDTVVDADGLVGTTIWQHRWATLTDEPDLRMRVVDRRRLEEMQSWCPVTENGLAAASPLADALLAARGTDERLWALAEPPASSSWVNRAGRDQAAAEAHAGAMAGSLDAVRAEAEVSALARRDRAARGTTLAEIHATEAETIVGLLHRSDARVNVRGHLAVPVTPALLEEALREDPASDAGRRLGLLVQAVRQPGEWPGGIPGRMHDGLVGACKLLRTYGAPGRVRRLWCDPVVLAEGAVRHGIGWDELRGMLEHAGAPSVALRRAPAPARAATVKEASPAARGP